MPPVPNQPASSKALGILQTLAGTNGYIALGIQVADLVIPLGKALIKDIKGIGQGAVTITFTDLVAADEAELAAIIQTSKADLDAVNAELAKLGLPPLSAPPTS
jgi:hypothetical protein